MYCGVVAIRMINDVLERHLVYGEWDSQPIFPLQRDMDMASGEVGAAEQHRIDRGASFDRVNDQEQSLSSGPRAYPSR